MSGRLSGTLTGRQTPQTAGVSPTCAAPAWRRGTRDQATGRASRPGYRVADGKHPLAGLHQLRAMSIPDGSI